MVNNLIFYVDCILCGEPFKQTGGKRYCSVKCRNEIERRLNIYRMSFLLPKNKKIRPCENCKKSFVTVFRCKFCSSVCTNQYHDEIMDILNKKLNISFRT